MAKISKLHGKEIEMKNGYVTHYESDRAKAMLYISEFDSEDQVRQQSHLAGRRSCRGGVSVKSCSQSESD